MNNQTSSRPLRAITWRDREKLAQRETEKARVKAEQDARDATINDGLIMYKDVLSTTPNGRAPRNTINKIIKELGSPPWMTRDHINNMYRKYSKNQKKGEESNKENVPVATITIHQQNSTASTVSPLTAAEGLLSLSSGESTEDIQRKKGGRPFGSTIANFVADKKKLEEAKSFAASKLKEKQLEAKKDGETLRKGDLDRIIEEAVLTVDLPSDAIMLINKKTIRQRVWRDNVLGYLGSYAHTSPMLPVEPILVGFCIQLNQMGGLLIIRNSWP
jgi:hypothetical protein